MNKKVADKEELLRVIDKNGTWRGRYILRSVAHDDNIPHNHVAIWIIDKTTKTVLMEQRSLNKRKNAGKWCLPGGHVVLDETFSEAAINEAKEEVGIAIPLNKLCFLWSQGPTKTFNCWRHHFYYITNKQFKNTKIQKEEVERVEYWKYSTFKKMVLENNANVVPNYDEYKTGIDIMDILLK